MLNILKIKKRGISPVIASVLLVVIVLIIALIVFLWLKGITKEAVVKFDKNVELVCEDLVFDVKYTDLQKLQVANNGNVPIYNLKIKIYDSLTKTTELKEINDLISTGNKYPVSNYGLQAGKTGIYSIPFDDGVNRIIVIPVLRGSSDSGEKDYVCDENRYGKEIIISE